MTTAVIFLVKTVIWIIIATLILPNMFPVMTTNFKAAVICFFGHLEAKLHEKLNISHAFETLLYSRYN